MASLDDLYEVESGIFGQPQSLHTAYTLTVADIWDAFPALRSEFADYPDLVDKERAKFAADVRVAAKRNREDAAYDRILELQ